MFFVCDTGIGYLKERAICAKFQKSFFWEDSFPIFFFVYQMEESHNQGLIAVTVTL